MSYFYVNGEIVSEENAKISVWDRSYQFGEGLFETFRSYDGTLPFLQNHLDRLAWSSTFLNIDFDLAKPKWICGELLAKNKIENARFKLVVSRAKEDEINIVIFCEALDEKNSKKEFKLKTIHNIKNDDQPIVTLKSTNYLTKILAKQEALDSGFDDGILLNQRGQVTETSSGNLFWVDSKGALNTIIKDSFHLAGTTAHELTKVLEKNKLTLKQQVVTPQDLSHAKEIFMTNSIVGIKPVAYIDHRKISGGEAGDITLMIQDLWKKHIEVLVEKEKHEHPQKSSDQLHG